MPQYTPPAVPQAPQFAPPAVAQAAVPAKAPANWLLIAIVLLLVFILGVAMAVLVLKH
jgi:hypothetical protein